MKWPAPGLPGATYDEDDGWHFDRRWPGLARRWLEAWTVTTNGDPAPWLSRSWGDWSATQVDLEAWPTPGDVGLGVNVDWEKPWSWDHDPHTRVTAALHVGLVSVTLTLWRRRPRPTPPSDGGERAAA